MPQYPPPAEKAVTFTWAIAAILVIAAALPVRADCLWSVVDATSVQTYGYVLIDGTYQYVPIYTTITLYWEAECTWDDPILIPPPDGRRSSTAETTQEITISQVNTVDPERPLITAEVYSDSPSYPVSNLYLLIDGYAQGDPTAINGNGSYTLSFPGMRMFGDGNTSIGVEACNSLDYCVEAQTVLTKATAVTPEVETQMGVYFIQGDDWFNYSYRHRFWQAYATAQFSTTEVGQNSRRQLKENRTTLSLSPPAPVPYPVVKARSYGTVFNSTITVDWCADGDALSPPYSIGRCGWFGTHGMDPSVDEWIDSLRLENLEVASIASGGALSVTIP